MEKYYVYAYLDPRIGYMKSSCGFMFEFQPMYIGFGSNNRMNDHLRDAIKTTKNNLKLNKIRKILNEGLSPIIIKISDNLNRDEAITLEKNLILDLGTIVDIPKIKRGVLTNMAPGGHGGVAGNKKRKPLSEAHKQSISEGVTIALQDETVRKKISDTHKGKTKSEEHRQKLGDNLRRVHNDPVIKEKMKIYRKENPEKFKHSAETKLKLSLNAVNSINTKWINNGEIMKRVDQDNVESYLDQGWVPGRINFKRRTYAEINADISP